MSEAVLAVHVHRRDVNGAECTVCVGGTYLASEPMADEVRCSSCGDTAPRWLTKRELLEHAFGKETTYKTVKRKA